MSVFDPRERMNRSILHVDINNFYASVEIRDDPSLAPYPVAVCGDREARHGIILAKNYIAKGFGVKTAEPIGEALIKCPSLVLVPCHFEKYEQITLESRALLGKYSDRMEPFGMDEAWLDISPYAPTAGDAAEIANEIREQYKKLFRLTASVGVSFNKCFAKLGSDMKKPDATTVITPENFKREIWPLPVEDLLFVGPKTKAKLNARGITTIGGLAGTDESLVRCWLGKNGVDLMRCANGLDSSPVARIGSAPPMKSIGNSFTPPRDVKSLDEALALLQSLGESVAYRMRKYRVLGTTVVLSVRDTSLVTFERQTSLEFASCISGELRDAAFALLKENYNWAKPIRSLGIRCTGLIPDMLPYQSSLFEDGAKRKKRLTVEKTVDAIRRRYGKTSILQARVFSEKSFEGALHTEGLFALR